MGAIGTRNIEQLQQTAAPESKQINSTHSSPAPDPHHRVIEETTPQLRSADPVHMMWHMAT